MFDQMKAMGALAGLLKNKDRLREIAEEFQQRLGRIDVEGSAGGGAVRVNVSGKMRVTNVHIDPVAITSLGLGADAGGPAGASGGGGGGMVQTLVLDATNEALGRAQAMVQDEARRMAQELDLPEIPGMDRLLSGG